MVNALRPDESPGMERTQEFGRMLRTLREQRNLTQEDLAELIDRSVQAVSKMERGLTLPKLETLIRISEKLNVPLRELVSAFDPNESADQTRISFEALIIESSRRLDIRDLSIVAKVVDAFPNKKKS
ncbi:XRE family transcriptional regulator [Azospirillum brasilense]|jgi:transcriptional regulator with XRE-family HTH domain|uniref:XRE family transcriptional regulator n=2 Tax=Azospirillum brasilense TaxID=192 RepID=A0A4D8QCH8_AZOBR|nr:XRE family transcriptional regulator [Azospirillum brasilense]QEL90291.1 XRE family transcriptional regulator [Azospirillum brasilense]QEL96592.1 XRE family transcriptional regulator [Azospirillum brasilense]